MRAIIPCAGYGTRMGMRPDESKEMLPDPTGASNDHIIDYCLRLCKILYLDPLIITRKEKWDLRQYALDKGIETMIIEPKGEWYDTVMESQFHWHEENILLLPDTRWQPYWGPVADIQNGLELGNNAIFALHRTNEPEKWGVINDYRIFDKPEHLHGCQWAWGLVGWKSEYGEKIFNTLDNKDKDKVQLSNVGFTYLESFKDITRNNERK